MRLLETTDGGAYRLRTFAGEDKIPPYAILSHTWQVDQEVTFEDLNKPSKLRALLRRRLPQFDKKGYRKLQFCAQQAKRDGIRYFWVDTCCIDKKDQSELQEAINSMFAWYRDAAKCYVFLSDVSTADRHGRSTSTAWQSAFVDSRWFTRGWTLQELLAPRVVLFFSREGEYLGDRLQLRQEIHDITKIPVRALCGASLAEFSIEERMSWSYKRQTSRKEDKAYSLLGFFNIRMSPRYGEGYDEAIDRLKRKIEKSQTIGGGHKAVTHETSFRIPFQRDSDFIPRKALSAIRQICAKPATCAALVGLGGVGYVVFGDLNQIQMLIRGRKSQIAIEYTYEMRDKSPTTWVFWVHAETQASFGDGYRTIAETTKMKGWDDPKVDVLRLVRNWLCDESNGRWVLVIDNADDASVFFHSLQSRMTDTADCSFAEPLANFIPRSSNGSIIFTTRSRDVAFKLTGSHNNIVDVKPMDDEDAFSLVQKKLGSNVPKDEAVVLIHAVEAMPLAITQAAAFITRRAPRMSISRYLEVFHRSDHDRLRLLEQDMKDSQRDNRASSSIITTWQISFEHIREQFPTAARLLSLMCLFDRHGIPESMLQETYGQVSSISLDFEDDIYTLSSYSLIELSADGTSFKMHRLVQISTKRWLELCNELEYWKEIYVALIDKKYPVGRAENWPVCQALYPHAQAALDNLPVDADALELWASISFKVSWYMGEMGEQQKAYNMAHDSFEVREILLGPEDAETLDSLNSLGIALTRLGRYDEAKATHRRALEAQERIFGAKDRDTLASMFNLAAAYNEEGYWEDTEKLLKQVLDTVGMTESFSDLRLDALTLLATTRRSQGRWADAVEQELQILDARTTELGKDHPTTLAVKSNLAFTYRKQGKLKEAEAIGLEVLRCLEATNGSGSELLTFRAHLASTYKAQGRYGEAENLLKDVIDASRVKLGPHHPDTLDRTLQLSALYWTQDRLQEAQELDVKTLELSTTYLEENHRTTLEAKASLASTYLSQGLLDKSEILTTELVASHTSKLGETHPLTLYVKANLAIIYRNQCRFQEAVQLGQYLLQTRSALLGAEHPDTLRSMSDLATTYEQQGSTREAIESRERHHRACKSVSSLEDPLIVGSTADLENAGKRKTQSLR